MSEHVISAEICQQCGQCCKRYPYVELSDKDIKALEEATGLRWDVFANPKGPDVGEYFMGFQENGDCFFLRENNGKYTCSVYEARPGVCRNYPWNPKQEEHCSRLSEKWRK